MHNHVPNSIQVVDSLLATDQTTLYRLRAMLHTCEVRAGQSIGWDDQVSEQQFTPLTRMRLQIVQGEFAPLTPYEVFVLSRPSSSGIQHRFIVFGPGSSLAVSQIEPAFALTVVGSWIFNLGSKFGLPMITNVGHAACTPN